MHIKIAESWLRHRSKACLIALLLLAFLLRTYQLSGQPLSWDEGWSIGLSSLPWTEINRITALDVHPPLYYHVLKLWLGLGQHELLLRFLSALLGLVTVALSFVVSRAWMRTVSTGAGSVLVGLLAVFVTALSPFLIYYSQVARMFALCTALSLLAAYCLLRGLETDEWRFYAGFALSATAAIYTFYYTAFILAAALLYALVIRRDLWPKLLVCTAAIGLLYLPWLLCAVPPMLQRVSSRTAFASPGINPLQSLADGLFGLFFAYGSGWPAVHVILGLLLSAAVLAWWHQQSLRHLLLPLLAISMSLVAVSIGARAHMFAARYLIAASPFLALLIAWAIAVYRRRSRWMAWLGLLLVVASVVPTLATYVYEKPYEVSGAFDPQADYRFLQERTSPDDIIFYNVLSLAGHYARFRTEGDPTWSYVLRWDPVIEPLQPALTGRVLPAASQHPRLWFVLYKGTVAANHDLKQWLDVNLFPTYGQWREDTLYLQYLPPAAPVVEREFGLAFDQGIHLRAVEFTSAAEPDSAVTVRLQWESAEKIEHSYKVFVHLYAADGRLVAQHDSVPMNELRPTWSWEPGEKIVDHHGLWVPADVSGPLRLVVGLYDPDSSLRLALPSGSDHAEVGIVQVAAMGT